MPRIPDPTRQRTLRKLRAGGVAALLALTLAGCGTDATPTPAAQGSATPSAGPWSWTDDLGQSVELDRTPVRIAAYGDEAAALWGFGITPVAIFHYMDPAQDSTFEDLDLSATEVVGSAYGEINLEELAAAQPDLIVTTTYDGDTPDSMYGFKDEAQLEKARAIAPVVGVAQVGSALDVIRTNEDLAASLGVDTGASSRVAEDRAAFEAASADLTEAAAGGLTVVPVYAEDSGLYYAKAPDDPALSMYADLGVSFTEVGGDDYYWQTVSWENADRYDPDLVLYSLRNSYTPERLADQPTFARLAAVRKDQLHPWKFKAMDYPSQTSYMEELAGWLSSDRDVAS